MKRTLLFFLLFVAIVFGIVVVEKWSHNSTEGKPEVKNLIYMIGDGMGLAHVSMLIIEDDYKNETFQSMSNVALATTYSANNRVTDSAAAGTALATGFKTNNSMLGVDDSLVSHPSIIDLAEQSGMATGIVVTSEIYHATPGSFYAHVEKRYLSQQICSDLTRSGVDVLFGGGREEMSKADSTGVTHFDRLLEQGYVVASDWSDVDSLTQGNVIALFADGHMPSMSVGRGDFLPKSTKKVLEILKNNSSANDKGFVLMVEGSQIDFESHGNNAEALLAEMRDFDLAVREAMKFVDENPGTLLVITADHETGGLSAPSGDPDFTLSERGIDYRFGSGSHTATLVPVYLYGTGAEQINGVIDNTELAKRLMSVMGLN